MKQKKLIRQIWEKKNPKQLMITIPLDAGLNEGDYVSIEKV
jgi:hypothetical protein